MKKTILRVVLCLGIIAMIFMPILRGTGAKTTKETKNTTTKKEAVQLPESEWKKKQAEGQQPAEKIDLPDATALGDLSPKQLDVLADYKLTGYQIDPENPNKINYSYQLLKATYGATLTVTAEKTDEASFRALLPTTNVGVAQYNGKEITFYERKLLYCTGESAVSDGVKAQVDAGLWEVKYGNTLDEIQDKQAACWYDEGYGYSIVAINLGTSAEDLRTMANQYIDNAK